MAVGDLAEMVTKTISVIDRLTDNDVELYIKYFAAFHPERWPFSIFTVELQRGRIFQEFDYLISRIRFLYINKDFLISRILFLDIKKSFIFLISRIDLLISRSQFLDMI